MVAVVSIVSRYALSSKVSHTDQRIVIRPNYGGTVLAIILLSLKSHLKQLHMSNKIEHSVVRVGVANVSKGI